MPARAICASSVDFTPLTPTAPRHWPSFMIGTTVLMASLAFSFQRYFEYQIEEARKISQ